jgi:SAM-dependent methyltransferase
VPERFHVPVAEEKLRYAKHTNSASDRKYVAYLSGIAADILTLPVASPRILDFGSGPEHVLSNILSERGAASVPHDPLYGFDATGATEKFDIVVLCETIEHVRNLPHELGLISRLVKPDGYVYVHTQLYDAVPDIRSWWYFIDVTHINFFCVRTMEKAGEMVEKRILSTNSKDTVVFG